MFKYNFVKIFFLTLILSVIRYLDMVINAIKKLFILLNIKNISKYNPDPKKMDRIRNTGYYEGNTWNKRKGRPC